MTQELKTQIATAIAQRAYQNGDKDYWRYGVDNAEGDDFGTFLKWSRGHHHPYVDIASVYYGPNGEHSATELEREEIEIMANDMVKQI